MKYTVLWRNQMLGSSGYRGTFDSEDAAREFRDKEARSARSFASFEIWTGTPSKPGKPIEGSLIKGMH